MMAPTLSSKRNPSLAEPQCSLRRRHQSTQQQQQQQSSSYENAPSFTSTYRQQQQQQQKQFDEQYVNHTEETKSKLSTLSKSILAAKSLLPTSSSSSPPTTTTNDKKASSSTKRNQNRRSSSSLSKELEDDDDTLTATTSSDASFTTTAAAANNNIKEEEYEERVTFLVEIVGAVKLSSSFASTALLGDDDDSDSEEEEERIAERELSSSSSLIETQQDGTNVEEALPSNGIHPYVLVKLCSSKQTEEEKEDVTIHKTKTIKNDSNPIYTISKGSLFLFDTALSSLSSSSSTSNKKEKKEELHFLLRNKRSTSQKLFSSSDNNDDESLGKVVIPTSSLLDLCNEERIECNVHHEEEDGTGSGGYTDMVMMEGGGWKYGGGFGSNNINSGGRSKGDKEAEKEEKRRKREMMRHCLRISGGNNGTLSLRFRVATKEDILFVRQLKTTRTTFTTSTSIPSSSSSQKSSSIFGNIAATMIQSSKSNNADRSLSDSMMLDYEATHDLLPATQTTTPSKWDIVRQHKHEIASSNNHNNNNNNTPKIAKLITEQEESEVAANSTLNTLFSIRDTLTSFNPSIATTTTTTNNRSLGGGVVRTKPYPDPQNVKNTTYMTEEQLELTSRLPSTNWISAGSGTLGKLYLEILHCTDLPNVDIGENLGNKTDTFITAIYEDVMVQTDVIDDSLNPLWMPWSQRAFVFNVDHSWGSSSTLYLGVFDYDLGLGEHEAIGRVAVGLGNLRSGGVYTMKFRIHPSNNVTERKSDGFVTIRLRLELNNERQALLSAILRPPPPRIHINCTKPKSFAVARYTVNGAHTDEHFELSLTRSYINELLEYKRMSSYAISDAVKSLMFWRGQVKGLPLHSFMFWVIMMKVVEQPRLLPAFGFFSAAWIMLATMGNRADHPSPWARCHTFWYYLKILLNIPADAKARDADIRIKSKENSKEAKAYEEKWKRRVDDDMEAALKKWEIQNRIAKIGDDNIQTETTKSTMADPLNAAIGKWGLPWQQRLGRYCRFFRFIKMVTTWEQSIISFWVTLAFLALGFISLFLPWCFIIQWTSRIVIWIFFGPWMKLVDIFVLSPPLHAETSKEGYEKRKEKNFRDMIKGFHEQTKEARLNREEALKLKDIKTMRFGKYITEVPTHCLERHRDRPEPESFAKPASLCRPVVSVEENRRTHSIIPGQNLYGTMIPRTKIASEQARSISNQEKERLLSILKSEMIPSSISSDALISPDGDDDGDDYDAMDEASRSDEVQFAPKKLKWQEQLEQQILDEAEQCEVEVEIDKSEDEEEGETDEESTASSPKSSSEKLRALRVSVMMGSVAVGNEEARQEDVSSRPKVEFIDRENSDDEGKEDSSCELESEEAEEEIIKEKCLYMEEEEKEVVKLERIEEEEGLEVIKWESTRDMSNSNEEAEEDQEGMCQPETETKKKERLMSVYQSSDSTYVAFIRRDTKIDGDVDG